MSLILQTLQVALPFIAEATKRTSVYLLSTICLGEESLSKSVDPTFLLEAIQIEQTHETFLTKLF